MFRTSLLNTKLPVNFIAICSSTAPLQITSNVSSIQTFPPYTLCYSCVARILSLPPDAITLQIGDLVWVDATIRSRDNPHAEIIRASLCGADPGSLTLTKSVSNEGVFTEKLPVPLEGIFKLEEKLVKGKEEGGLGYKISDFALLGSYLLAVGGLASSNIGVGDTVIVGPATGKFSGAGVLIALAMGCKVVATARKAEKLKIL